MGRMTITAAGIAGAHVSGHDVIFAMVAKDGPGMTRGRAVDAELGPADVAYMLGILASEPQYRAAIMVAARELSRDAPTLTDEYIHAQVKATIANRMKQRITQEARVTILRYFGGEAH